jgi:hypothetical protein
MPLRGLGWAVPPKVQLIANHLADRRRFRGNVLKHTD